MAADAGSWLVRAAAGRRQVAGDQADALAIDQLPPIHAGSKVSTRLQEEFRRLLHGDPPAAEARPRLLFSLPAGSPPGAAIIACFASRIGEVRLGLPPPGAEG